MKATWMVTHQSPAVKRLGEMSDLFELGLHPNFLPGSSHGETPAEVLSTCLSLVPDARCMRTHALVQSSPLFSEICALTRLEIDLSLFLPGARYITPIVCQFGGRSLIRAPYFWEDDTQLYLQEPTWSRQQIVRKALGLKIFNFHPFHIYLNSQNLGAYEYVKSTVDFLPSAQLEEAQPLRSAGAGVETLFIELLDQLGSSSHTVSELVDLCNVGDGEGA